MEKSTTKYWAIFQGKDILFEGTFQQCWNDLMVRYANITLYQLQTKGIRIARKS